MDEKWWELPKEDIYKQVFMYLKKLEERQGYRADAYLVFARLYGNSELSGLTAYNYARVDS